MGLGKLGKSLERGLSNMIPHEHSAAKRAAMASAAEQMSFYQEQKAALRAQSESVAREKDLERQRLQAKQIRSMRRTMSAPGFMDSGAGVDSKMG
jgi:tryptophan 2,3-dioxygenase